MRLFLKKKIIILLMLCRTTIEKLDWHFQVVILMQRFHPTSVQTHTFCWNVHPPTYEKTMFMSLSSVKSVNQINLGRITLLDVTLRVLLFRYLGNKSDKVH